MTTGTDPTSLAAPAAAAAKTLESIANAAWRPMLRYVAELHSRCTHPPRPPFPHPWEEIGTGYCYGPAFGHWDIVHQILDVLPHEPEHARMQIENNLAAQQEDGLVPGSIWMRDAQPRWNAAVGHPPVWPVAVEELAELVGPAGRELIRIAYPALVRQIGWFERNRSAEDAGFYYTDILSHRWESGVDEGVRFDEVATGPLACVDATSHMYTAYRHAEVWALMLGEDPSEHARKADALRSFIQNELYCEETGFFHDIWAARDRRLRRGAFEGMWPVVVGAATPRQAGRAIRDHLMNPARFFSTHPIATVALDEPRFELRMWRGPAWNSMTFWAARGCAAYGHADAARLLLQRALDASAEQFDRTGTVWEFYHPHGGPPEELTRKPQTPFNAPCRDYLGHNPLIAMAGLYERLGADAGQPAPRPDRTTSSS